MPRVDGENVVEAQGSPLGVLDLGGFAGGFGQDAQGLDQELSQGDGEVQAEEAVAEAVLIEGPPAFLVPDGDSAAGFGHGAPDAQEGVAVGVQEVDEVVVDGPGAFHGGDEAQGSGAQTRNPLEYGVVGVLVGRDESHVFLPVHTTSA